MSEQKLKYFPQQVYKVPAFKDAKIYKMKDSRLFDIETGDVADDELLAATSGVKAGSEHFKLKKSGRIAFLLENCEIIVTAKFPSQTRSTTISKHLSRLREHLSSAKSSYNAHHDELTGVLNRHGIKHSIQLAYRAASVVATGSEEADQQFSDKADIALFAFDIDRFKSINDSFGHEAGDTVLSAFASRLNTLICTLQSSYSATFIFGRPGGEEFELVCVGAVSRQERIEIGDLLLHEIRKPMTYTEVSPVSISKIKENLIGEVARLPSQVTASIGVAWNRGAEAANADAIISDLRKDADAALYRAKADGRNCLRAYEDIRRYHGRVLEFHKESGLVQIDIGSKVGVRIGQVYSVFYPPFTGTEKMRTSDSSKKILGDYPKLPSGKIQVIACESEIATALIIQQVNSSEIPAGSLLQYLPVGSKIFPHNRSLTSIALTSPLSELYDHLLERLNTDSLYALITLNWGFEGAQEQRREKQAELYTLFKFYLPSGSRIFYSSGNSIFISIPKSEQDAATDLELFASNLGDLLAPSGFKIAMGICCPELLPPHVSNAPEALAFYASSALRSLKTASPNFVIFDNTTPHATIEKWRKEMKSDDALVDYQNFRLYGFDSPFVDNQIGLAIIGSEATEHFALAEAAFSRAAAAHTHKIFLANLALLQTLRKKYKEALNNFEKTDTAIVEKNGIYFLALAKCNLETYQSGTKISKEKLLDLSMRAIECFSMPPTPPYDRLWMDIKRALKEENFD